MSRLKTDAIRNVNASVDGITLDTSGNVAIPNELQLADKIVHTGDTNTFIRFPAADTVSVETAGSERLRITSAGILEVYPSTNSAGQLNLKRGTSTDQEATFYYGSSYLDIETREATGIRLKTNKQDRVVIDSSGHVGIGRASGLELLDVKGVDDDSIKFSASTYGGGHLRIVGADKTISGTAGPFNYSVRFKTKTQNNNGGNGAESDALILYHEGWSGLNVASFPNSSVGIGTTSPTATAISGNTVNGVLHIDSSGADSASAIKLGGKDGSSNSNYAQIGWAGADNRLDFTVNGNQALQIEPDKDVKVVDGNLLLGTAGKGIDFSNQTATGASGSTSTSELLDHYEEGTWTPEIRKGDTTSNGTATTVNGYYVRIGRLLFLTGYYYKSSGSNTASGSWKIFGLPFAISTTNSSSYTSGGEGYLGFNGTNQFNSDKNWRWQANHSDRLTMYGSLTGTNWNSGYFETSFQGTFLIA